MVGDGNGADQLTTTWEGVTEAEARKILGVGADATKEEMQEAYRKLMGSN